MCPAKRFIKSVALLVLCFASSSIQAAYPDASVIERAKAERELVWWTTISLDQSKKVAERFEQKYPFIKVQLFRTGALNIQNKIVTEAQAGRYSWDVATSNAEFVLELLKRKLLASYISPEARMFDDDLKSKNGYWTALFAQPIALGFNTKQVREKDIPRTYEDLLDPKWKSRKISMDDEGFGLLKGLSDAWGREKAVAFLKKLAAQEPVIIRGNTHRVQLVAAGEYPILIAFAHSIQWTKHAGAPIDWLPLEPVPVQLNVIKMAAHAPHKSSAMLFVDFILSFEGQTLLGSMQRIPLRNDVEPNPPRLFRGYKRIVLQPEKYTDHLEIMRLYQEIFNLR